LQYNNIPDELELLIKLEEVPESKSWAASYESWIKITWLVRICNPGPAGNFFKRYNHQTLKQCNL